MVQNFLSIAAIQMKDFFSQKLSAPKTSRVWILKDKLSN